MQLRLNLYEIAMMGAALGLLFGLIPLILGFIKKERSYAVWGFLGSIIGGAISFIFVSVPVIAVFTWLILRKPKNVAAEVASVNQSPTDITVENSENR